MHHHRRTSAAQPLSSHWLRHVHSLCRFFWKHRYVFHPRAENVSPAP
jgi:hypothetical protein